MIFSKYKEEKNILKMIAKREGISVAEVREQMELAIDEAYQSDDPKVQKDLKKLFGNRRPTPEEFIYKMSKKLIKEN